jgi:hypothetical protein
VLVLVIVVAGFAVMGMNVLGVPVLGALGVQMASWAHRLVPRCNDSYHDTELPWWNFGYLAAISKRGRRPITMVVCA